MRYHIEMSDNRGNFAADAIAESIGGATWVVSNTQKFDGRNDLAIIEVASDFAAELDAILDADENVVRYRVYEDANH